MHRLIDAAGSPIPLIREGPPVRGCPRPLFTRLIAVAGAVLVTGCSTPAPAPQESGKVHGSLIELGDNQMRAEAQCLAAAGWEVTVKDDGYDTVVPPEQKKAFDADSQTCSDTVRRSIPPPTLTVEDYTRLYAHFVTTAKCLSQHGYEPLGPPPSEQSFIDDAVRNDGSRWNPYDAVTTQPSTELLKDCPEFPPGW